MAWVVLFFFVCKKLIPCLLQPPQTLIVRRASVYNSFHNYQIYVSQQFIIFPTVIFHL
uniref:Uncharacterized protein n=1 Tax=Meloidogyne enterolobii TaxID=390850 RepID=A0A6V7U7P1_MELEN|nr:unnamed protein product [Meloidogyne enterolobii]